MASQNGMRIGFGKDVHRLVAGRPLKLGGVAIPFEKGLEGHSDADVLLHAIADAMLGAAALGDIGMHFPDTDAAYKDADSAGLLANVARLLDENGWAVVNIDCVVVAQAPKIAPFREQMAKRIATILNIEQDCVGIKATTFEGLGFIGQGEGIAAECVALIERK